MKQVGWQDPLLPSTSSARGGCTPTVNCGRGSCQPSMPASGRDAALRVNAKQKEQTRQSFNMPGQFCPSEIRCTVVMEIALHIARQLPSGMSHFWKRSLRPTHAASGTTPRSSDVWPCPPPCWGCWTKPTKLSPRRRKRVRFFQLRTQVLQAVVITLNWLTLGHARSPPECCRIGAPTSAAQEEALARLEEMVHHFLTADDADVSELGRAGEKLGNLCKAGLKLPSLQGFGDSDLHSFLENLSMSFDPYSKRHFKTATESHSDASSSCASDQEESGSHFATMQPSSAEHGSRQAVQAGSVQMDASVAKPVVASRIKWKLGPSFDPRPYLSDPVVKDGFEDPETLRLPEDQWPHRGPATVHATKTELLRLAEKWDALGACRLVKCSDVGAGEHCGMFAVYKDEEYDRLILNPTVLNSRMKTTNKFTKTLTPGHMISMIRLLPHEGLVISSDDLSEFYYTFCVSDKRARRNAIGKRFRGHELQHLQCYSDELKDQFVYVCLGTLAMGDNLAVEVAQQAHFNVLRMHAGALASHEVLMHRRPMPRGPCYEMLTIDDHIVLQKVQRGVPLDAQATRDKVICERSETAYKTVGLVPHPGKRQRQVSSTVALGAEIHGDLGRVHAPRSRVALLIFATAVIVQKGFTTRRLLQCLLGSWIHVLLFRRPAFSVLSEVFSAGKDCRPDQVFRMSPRCIDELLVLLLLGPVIQADLRVNIADELFMMDASPYGGAICRVPVTKQTAEELWRHSELRGFHTKLESGAGEVLTELGLDSMPVFGESSVPAELGPLAQEDVGLAYGCIELFAGSANWSKAHKEQGFSVHPGVERDAVGLKFGDLSDNNTFLRMVRLADSGQVKEWHAAPPCWSYGTLRRPRLRSKSQPAGFEMRDPVTLEQTILAVRTCFILTVAILRGAFVSIEQPGSSVMFELACFQRLLDLGCRITKFAFCNYGSAFNKPSKWLHNKPWLTQLGGTCSCPYSGRHFVIEGSFTKASVRVFDQRCRPSAAMVYGRQPRPGEAVSSFSAA